MQKIACWAAPGAVKISIEDMNNDGLKDIIALFAQADESVYIFFQKPGLKFEAKRVLHFPPDLDQQIW
jgi:hypothetical protein